LGKSSKECGGHNSIGLPRLRALAVGTIIILAVAFAALPTTLEQPAHAACIADEDWPDKPCLDTPPYSKEYLLQVWQQYYEYKGKEWMEEKKAEMDMAIQNGLLRQWVETESSPNNFANYNVWRYYNLNGEAPDAYGTPLSPEMVKECERLDIDLANCSEAALLARIRTGGDLPLSDEEMKRLQDQQDAINNSMYMIGAGAAIAGAVAFVTLRKIK